MSPDSVIGKVDGPNLYLNIPHLIGIVHLKIMILSFTHSLLWNLIHASKPGLCLDAAYLNLRFQSTITVSHLLFLFFLHKVIVCLHNIANKSYGSFLWSFLELDSPDSNYEKELFAHFFFKCLGFNHWSVFPHWSSAQQFYCMCCLSILLFAF